MTCKWKNVAASVASSPALSAAGSLLPGTGLPMQLFATDCSPPTDEAAEVVCSITTACHPAGCSLSLVLSLKDGGGGPPQVVLGEIPEGVQSQTNVICCIDFFMASPLLAYGVLVKAAKA